MSAPQCGQGKECSSANFGTTRASTTRSQAPQRKSIPALGANAEASRSPREVNRGRLDWATTVIWMTGKTPLLTVPLPLAPLTSASGSTLPSLVPQGSSELLHREVTGACARPDIHLHALGGAGRGRVRSVT